MAMTLILDDIDQGLINAVVSADRTGAGIVQMDVSSDMHVAMAPGYGRPPRIDLRDDAGTLWNVQLDGSLQLIPGHLFRLGGTASRCDP